MNLIERFYDVSSGFVAIDGTDVREVDASMLRRSLGLVRQEPVLFATTIGDNISVERQATAPTPHCSYNGQLTLPSISTLPVWRRLGHAGGD